MKQSNLDIARIFKALSNPQRLKIFMHLYDCFGKENKSRPMTRHGCCGGVNRAFTQTCARSHLARSTVSHHFKELENAGLIICEKAGQSTTCRVNQEAVKLIKDFLK